MFFKISVKLNLSRLIITRFSWLGKNPITVFTILCNVITVIMCLCFTCNSLEVNWWYQLLLCECKPLQIHSLPSSPWFLLPYPSNADGFMSWEQKWLLLNSDYMPLRSALSFPVTFSAPALFPTSNTQPHTHIYIQNVYACWSLLLEDKLLWFGSQPARSSAALCRGQGVFAYPQGSGNINKPLSGHISMTE